MASAIGADVFVISVVEAGIEQAPAPIAATARTATYTRFRNVIMPCVSSTAKVQDSTSEPRVLVYLPFLSPRHVAHPIVAGATEAAPSIFMVG